MPINREPQPSSDRASEASTVRRAPHEHEDAHELQEHEFTLEPEEATPSAGGSTASFDEHTVPWGTLPLPPLPPWATTARALLEPPTIPLTNQGGVFYDDQPTPAVETIARSGSAFLALHEELAHAQREAREQTLQIQRLERTQVEAKRALAELRAELARARAEHEGHTRGQAFRIAELEGDLQSSRAALLAAEEALRDAELRVTQATLASGPELIVIEPANADEQAEIQAAAEAEYAPLAAADLPEAFDASEPPSDVFDRVQAEAVSEADGLTEASGDYEAVSLEAVGGGEIDPTLEVHPSDLEPATERGEAEPETPPVATSVRELAPRASRPARRDDLRQIRGIGARYAERLAELGHTTYARIAAWSPKEIARVSEELGIGPMRIRREAWVKQAKKLHVRAGRAAKPAAKVRPRRAGKRA